MKPISLSEIAQAFEYLEKEEGLDKEYLKEAFEAGITNAYKDEYDIEDEISVKIRDLKKFDCYIEKKVVESVQNKATEISIEDAKKIKARAKIGDNIEIPVNPNAFGRMAVQRGKQVIIQKLREKTKEIKFNEYNKKVGEVITGVVQKADGGAVILDAGKIEAIMLPREQVPNERYKLNQKIKVYVINIQTTENKDVQIFVSRRSKDFVKRMFEYEIPEIEEGIIQIKAVARDAGNRTKIAVYSNDDSIDPVGSCVGLKGLRIQNIIDEINGEKIDVVEWSEDPSTYIAAAILPAEVLAIDIDENEKFAQVIVPDEQLSLAIVKNGKNVRLAVELTGWKIDIKSISQYRQLLEKEQENKEEVEE